MSELREKILERIDAVPAIPVSAAKAIHLLQDENKNLSEAIRIIEYDPGLTANILKLVNSSAFAAGRKISTLKDATTRLGATNILQMLVGSSMAGVMKLPVKGYDLPPGELWKSSVSGAIYSDMINTELKLKLPPHTFTATLLRDVGKMVLGSFIDVNAEEIVSLSVERKMSFIEAEREVLGIDHSEVGAILLETWNLPQELRNPVRYHHIPDQCPEEDRTVTEIVHIADALTILEGIGSGCEGLNYRISDKVATRLGLSMNMIEAIVCRAQARRNEVKEFLQA